MSVRGGDDGPRVHPCGPGLRGAGENADGLTRGVHQLGYPPAAIQLDDVPGRAAGVDESVALARKVGLRDLLSVGVPLCKLVDMVRGHRVSIRSRIRSIAWRWSSSCARMIATDSPSLYSSHAVCHNGSVAAIRPRTSMRVPVIVRSWCGWGS